MSNGFTEGRMVRSVAAPDGRIIFDALSDGPLQVVFVPGQAAHVPAVARYLYPGGWENQMPSEVVIVGPGMVVRFMPTEGGK